jgi:RHS repeat-associated protein
LPLPEPTTEERLLGEGSIRILPGQYFDKETGLAYNYFRDYDPQTGRYVQPDPLGVKVSGKSGATAKLNQMYGYANQDPLRFIDPRGEQGITLDANFQGFLGAFGGKSAFGFAFGNNVCFKVETCGRGGIGLAGGINVTAGFTTGELCTKVVDSTGIFATGGPFLGGLSSLKDTPALSAALGGGVGGGVAGGIEACRTQYYCIIQEPCGCTPSKPNGNVSDVLAP